MANLKCLGQFNHFDLDGFLADKTLVLTGTSPWKDYTSKEVLGTKAELTITRDKTVYKLKDGQQVTNLYNKLVVKVRGAVTIPIGEVVIIVDGKATVYGEYRNQLSIEAASVQPANNGGKA